MDLLPDELLVEILVKVDFRSRDRFYQTCRKFAFASLRGAARDELRRRCKVPENVATRLECREYAGCICEFDGFLAVGRNRISLWNAEGALVQTFGEEESGEIWSLVEFDGKIAAGTEEGVIRLWTREGICATTLMGHSDTVRCLCVLEELLASGSDDNTIVLWDESGTCVRTLYGHENSVVSLVAFEGLLASGSYDRTVKLWEVSSGTGVRTLTGHTRGVSFLRVFAGFLVSGSQDSTIRWWDSRGACIKVLRGHPTAIIGLTNSERLLVSSCWEDTKFWNSQGDCLRTIYHDDTSQWIRPLLFWRGLLVESTDEWIVLWK